MKEYLVENNTTVDLDILKSEKLPLNYYKEAHNSLVILCHDVFIEYEGGVLLIVRKNPPAKDILWPIGGRVERGMKTEDSLRKKVKTECNLELEDIRILGFARTYFYTDPFGHGRGTDTFNVVYTAKGKGNVLLDNNHKNATIINNNINSKHCELGLKNLHPYVEKYLKLMSSKTKQY